MPFLGATLFSVMTLVKLRRDKSLGSFTTIHERIPSNCSSNLNNVEAVPLKPTQKKPLAKGSRENICKKSKSFALLKPYFENENNAKTRRVSLPIAFDVHTPNTFHKKSNILKSFDASNIKIYSQKKPSKAKITLMLLIFPLTYIIMTSPVLCVITFKMLNPYFKIKNDLNVELAVAKMLMFLNNSINILLLIIFGKNLRKDFVKILCSRKYSAQRTSF